MSTYPPLGRRTAQQPAPDSLGACVPPIRYEHQTRRETMKRRDFIKSAVAASVASQIPGLRAQERTTKPSGHTPIPKRVYRDDVKLSMIGFGGIVVMGGSQQHANDLVAEAFDRGINYFDVAPLLRRR